MRVCPYCAAENADKALFCVSCGSSLRNSYTKKIPVRKIAEIDDEMEKLKTSELFEDPDVTFDEIDEAMEFEMQMNRYKHEQGGAGGRKDRKGRKEDKRIILVGIICILGVLVGGILAFNLLSGSFTGKGSKTTTARLSDDMIKELTREKEPEVEIDMPDESEKIEEAKEEKTEKADKAPEKAQISASLMTAADLDKKGYSRVNILKANASSVIEQEGFDNTPIRAADGNENTSWQEGVDGPGIHETIDYTLDRSYDIHCMTFKLGNWASESYFWKNNRPATITIWFDDVGYEVTFPDGMTEYAILFGEDIPASKVQFEINSVYAGDTYDDTCISDIGIYGT